MFSKHLEAKFLFSKYVQAKLRVVRAQVPSGARGPNLWDSSQYRLWDTTWDVRLLGSIFVKFLWLGLKRRTQSRKIVAEVNK